MNNETFFRGVELLIPEREVDFLQNFGLRFANKNNILTDATGKAGRLFVGVAVGGPHWNARRSGCFNIGGADPAFVGSAKGIDCRASGRSSRERIGAATGKKGVDSNPCPPEIWLHGSLAGGAGGGKPFLREDTGGNLFQLPFRPISKSLQSSHPVYPTRASVSAHCACELAVMEQPVGSYQTVGCCRLQYLTLSH
ncbi:hypothetical protein DSTSK_09010 [Desulforhabdus sp. TSK]|nr:hypothetical protein DSTSK_09010 [Desulforhabdus sp. TSK]